MAIIDVSASFVDYRSDLVDTTTKCDAIEITWAII